MGFFSNIMGGGAISAKEARQKMEQGGDFILLDVRTPQEYKQIRIKGAKLIPVDELGARAPKELPDKDAAIYIYCQSGARAGNAVKILTRMGYTNAVSFGGIMSWPYEMVQG
ncbi:MAG: rhodanese-like domain-containing protein [Clostridiales bacterium]|nr:rhodanese-like domain-containing protein [Clostridiales bacterium]